MGLCRRLLPQSIISEVRRSCHAAIARVKASLEAEQRRADRAAAQAAAASAAQGKLEASIVTLQRQLRVAVEQVEAGKEQLKQLVQLKGGAAASSSVW